MIFALLGKLRRYPAPLRWGLLAAGLLAALGLPWALYPPVAADILCWGLFAVAFDLLLGHAGLLSFGHAAFWGTSAYATGLIAIHSGLPFYVPVLGGAAAAALLAAPIGWLAVRRSGIYFAMVTLAFAQMVYFIANQWGDVTGGENGLQGIPRELPGIDLSDSFVFYYAMLPVVLLGLAAAWRIVRSPFGRVVAAVRENPDRVRALGYSADRYKLVVFVVSAFLSGLAGGLYAVNHGFASLQEVYWTTSGKVVVMTVLGGIGTLWGSLIGAAAVVRLEDWLSTAGFEETGLVTGGVFIVAVLVFRRGVWGTIAHVAGVRGGGERAEHEPHVQEPDGTPQRVPS
ncbi:MULTISPECIES: branched-chain amino acid ABC transporter permease [Streptomyces]|uniref:Branched-chain amino acid ABC transporter permease n=1 Tax=Streptomyces dengpaensis TaxID=2049881 RepID=A0ABN5I096_9ACTN|nr:MULTISPECIES: branched-chain amino acid ABC transporter permease [Streptomyces]AVH55282.1 branched-chain amino acid ABC transporter permease [Streptomyces dengpaensis]PIB07351.1 branched-chain amino acid ABC transporter permease [Streptomyces sp. HG99]